MNKPITERQQSIVICALLQNASRSFKETVCRLVCAEKDLDEYELRFWERVDLAVQ